jgi:replicative superfamily II helicase
VLGENSRGATIEVVVSRMKTFALTVPSNEENDNKLRFIAVSATIPNINDVSI